MTSTQLDEFYYARDHERGPGAWCVRGPNDYCVSVGSKTAAFILAKALSGNYEDAETMADLERRVAAKLGGGLP